MNLRVIDLVIGFGRALSARLGNSDLRFYIFCNAHCID